MASDVAAKTAFAGGPFVWSSALQESRNIVTTGYPSLDNLVGGLRGGQLYLLCGTTPFLDQLVHRLVVRGASGGKVAYMNNTDYYHEKTLLRGDLLAFHAKRERTDPMRVLGNVYFVAAYTEFRQPKATTALRAAVEREPSTRMVVAHNISTFLLAGAKKGKTLDGINRSISSLWHLAMERDLILVVTAGGEATCSSLLTGLANVIVFFRGAPSGVRAVLLKHPGRETAEATIQEFAGTAEGAGAGERGDLLMGRITPPFRQLYQETLEQLQGNYVAFLREPGNRKGFELLLKEAWDREHAAMGNSELPLVLDALNLTANVHNSGAIAELREALAEREGRIEALEERIRRLESFLTPSAVAKSEGEAPQKAPLGR